MRRSATAPHNGFKPRLVIFAAMAMIVIDTAAALFPNFSTSLLVGPAAAQQADRVVPPAAIAGKMAPVDEAFVLFAASSSLAQIEGARLVLKSTKNAGVVEFAQRIVREHTDTLDRLRSVVSARGLELPAAATGRHADLVTKLAGVAPPDRDEAFIHRFGLDAHKEAIAVTERHVKEGRDPELKRYAEQTLQPLRDAHIRGSQACVCRGRPLGDGACPRLGPRRPSNRGRPMVSLCQLVPFVARRMDEPDGPLECPRRRSKRRCRPRAPRRSLAATICAIRAIPSPASGAARRAPVSTTCCRTDVE